MEPLENCCHFEEKILLWTKLTFALWRLYHLSKSYQNCMAMEKENAERTLKPLAGEEQVLGYKCLHLACLTCFHFEMGGNVFLPLVCL